MKEEEKNAGMSPTVNLKIQKRVQELVDKCKLKDQEAEAVAEEEEREREKRRLRLTPKSTKFKI